VVGAAWSAVLLARGRSRPGGSQVTNPSRLVVGNVLIALGTLVLGASGTVAGRIGAVRAFALSLVIGITVLFSGFLVATSSSDKTSKRVSTAVNRRNVAPTARGFEGS
jgi:formate hydrogenlyase subunit 4